MTNQRKHYKFSVDQYEQMIKHAILDKYDIVELLRGEIVEKVRPVSARHAATKSILGQLFHELIDKQATVSACGAIRLADSMLEPDLFLLKRRADNYMHAFPTAVETLLVVEIADETLAFDRTYKKQLYGENKIPEYWVVDLIDQRIEVYRQPQANGEYGEVLCVSHSDSLVLSQLPAIKFHLRELFDPVE